MINLKNEKFVRNVGFINRHLSLPTLLANIFFVAIVVTITSIIIKSTFSSSYYNKQPLFRITTQSNHLAQTDHSNQLTYLNLQNLATSTRSITLVESQNIPQPSYLLSSHSATLVRLPNNRLLALWFAGSKEGNSDVQVWQSSFINNHWMEATSVVSPQLLSKNTGMFTKKVGNPVVYLAANHILHLFVVSVGIIGGWSGSNINHLISSDYGKSWQLKNRLHISPFFNVSTLVRTNPIALSDGGFYLPVYHEFIRSYPQLLRFDSQGNFISQSKINSINHLIQPAIIAVTPQVAYLYVRNHNSHNTTLYMQKTNNGGQTFGALKATNLHNQDSSIAVTSITTHAAHTLLVMVYNVGHRNILALALSQDGIHWYNAYTLERHIDNEVNEFSYPAISVNSDMIDVLYTYQRKYIKHVRLKLANQKDSIANALIIHNTPVL